MASSMQAKPNINDLNFFLHFREKFKSKVVINGGKTKYKCSQRFFFFLEKSKINVVVINVGKINFQCSLLFLEKFKITVAINVGKTKNREKFKINVHKVKSVVLRS
jgi:nucleoside phosphorylase